MKKKKRNRQEYQRKYYQDHKEERLVKLKFKQANQVKLLQEINSNIMQNIAILIDKVDHLNLKIDSVENFYYKIYHQITELEKKIN